MYTSQKFVIDIWAQSMLKIISLSALDKIVSVFVVYSFFLKRAALGKEREMGVWDGKNVEKW